MTDSDHELRMRELHHFETEQENANLHARIAELEAEAKRVIRDRRHHVILTFHQREALIEFLKNPNGSHRTGADNRVCVEACTNGGVYINTDPYRYIDPRTRR